VEVKRDDVCMKEVAYFAFERLLQHSSSEHCCSFEA
jgi:hypothetical protein